MNSKPSIYALAQAMRLDPTPMESRLWESLRGCRTGAVFRRQRVLGPCIVDFYSSSHLLAVEVDGPIHDEQVEADARRSAYLLTHHKVRVLRFTNHQVEWHLADVEASIRCAVQSARP